MNTVMETIRRRSMEMQQNRPDEMNDMRKRMGARNQNNSIALYAFSDNGAAKTFLFVLQQALMDPVCDLETVKKIACEWISFISDRNERYYKFHESAQLCEEVAAELRKLQDRELVQTYIGDLQHYFAQLFFWLDLEIPWAEFGKTYACAKGDHDPDI